MATKTTANAGLSTANTIVSVTIVGTGPFTTKRDGDHGTLVIYNADGTPATLTLSSDAVVGYSGATSESANAVFASHPNAQAIVDEIVTETNAA